MLNRHQQQLAPDSLALKVLADGQFLDMQLVVDFHRPQKSAKLLISEFGHPHPSAADCLQVLFGVGYRGLGKPGEAWVQAKQLGGRAFNGGEGGGITWPGPAYNKTHDDEILVGAAAGCDLSAFQKPKIAARVSSYKGFTYNST